MLHDFVGFIFDFATCNWKKKPPTEKVGDEFLAFSFICFPWFSPNTEYVTSTIDTCIQFGFKVRSRSSHSYLLKYLVGSFVPPFNQTTVFIHLICCTYMVIYRKKIMK